MSELMQSIIFAIFGAVITISGLITSASWEVIGLGIVLTVIAVACIIINNTKNHK